MKFSRRALLTTTVAAAVTGSFSCEAGAANNPLGAWTEDVDGLPAFDLTADLPLATKDKTGASYPLPGDPYFLLGNYRLTLFVHGSGLYRMMTGERAWALTNSATDQLEGSGAQLSLDGQVMKLTGTNSLAEKTTSCRRRFGTGYCAFDYSLPDGISVLRSLNVAPSVSTNAGTPAFLIAVTLTNRSSRTRTATYEESVLANYTTMAEHFTAVDQRHLSYKPTVAQGEHYLIASIGATASDPTALLPRDAPAHYDAYPPAIVLAGRPQKGVDLTLSHSAIAGAENLVVQTSVKLRPGEVRSLLFVIGLVTDGNAAPVLAALEEIPDKNGLFYRDFWRQRLPNLNDEPDKILKREMVWNAYVLEAMATYSEFYGETFIPQGMTYDYELDLTAAPRDHLQHALAACYTNPALAKSAIRFVLAGMTAEGEIRYTRGGYGKTSNSAWSTSDQQLYLFQTVAEYLRITGDYAFLVETSRFNPKEANFFGSTLDKLVRAFAYLRDEVGMGPHGLVKLLNSDWNDMIYTQEPLLLYFGSAESHMNSAMAIAVVPELIEQLKAASVHTVDVRLGQLIEGLQTYVAKIQTAFFADLGDRTFSRRLYFKADKPFGETELHLEPQSFLLQCADFPVDRKRELLGEIRNRVMNSEVLGPRQRETPDQAAIYPPGTSENGGFWYSLAGQMILGVNTFDKVEAQVLLRQMTFDNFSRHFPSYWPGQWSAPDTISSKPSGQYEGLPRPGDGFFWLNSPVYCAHPHAWPLYTYYRLRTA